MSVTRHHADWLSLVEVSGPFVSLPVLQKVFPQGLEGRDPAQAKALRATYEEWQDNPTAPGKQRAWVMHVLTAVLGYPENQIAEGQSLPAGLEANMPEMGETLRPDFALVAPAGTDIAGQPQLLVASYPAEQSLDKPVIGKHWKATPATRMMELLHGANVPLGLVTNGEHWMLVYAPRGETTGYASWYGSLWLDEPITLRAFHSLLGVRRFFGVAADSTLLALLKESANDQLEVTDQLGYQVREAVEVLVQSFDTLDKESNRTLLKGIKPANLYDSALTIMMRLVFLFSAEERGLLHLGKPLYDDNYAVSTLQEQLQEVADRYGEEVLERRYDAWTRLLATFRAVHGGIQHQDLLMQAYGGSLFDPDRYPFLEGRGTGSQWRSTSAEPLSVNNRVVLHLLNSLQRLRTKVGAGTMAETRRVSFRALGVEQIGHVYEGLLDHTAFRADQVVLGIRGTRKKEPEIALSTLEDLLSRGEDKLLDFLKEETDRSLPALRKELNNGVLLDEHKLLVACDHDEALVARLRPIAGLIRDDSFDRPWVVLPGSIFVTAGTARRSTGTHYTPPSLTEPIVQHTLEPLVYVGPAEGLSKDQWKLKSPKEILDLKVCDMAMGSGAFLVQACRYLAERLVEAWENEETTHPGQVLITPDGQFSEGSPSERLVPAEAAERIAIARRVVADRCLYGVDINPMAVEMAKLSMWLITVDANRPFTFLDHAFKCGDSLLGITSLEQLENFSLRPGGGKQQAFATLNLWRHIEEAKKKRELLEAMPSDTPEQIAAKAALYAEAEESVAKLSAAADVLVAFELQALEGRAYEAAKISAADQLLSIWSKGVVELQELSREKCKGRHFFHWTIEFPEIFSNGGFSAFVGNPPFLGGKQISSTLGADYWNYLRMTFPRISGNMNYVGLFPRRSAMLMNPEGAMAGLISAKGIAEGDTREGSLVPLLENGYVISWAITALPWPGTADVFISALCFTSGPYINPELNGARVSRISSRLEAEDEFQPFPLNGSPKNFNGMKLGGEGFILNPLDADCPDIEQPVVKQFVRSGSAFSHIDRASTVFVVDFGDMSEEEAQSFPTAYKWVWNHVRPYRLEANRASWKRYWWRHAEVRPGLRQAMVGKNAVLVIGGIATYHRVQRCPIGLYDHNLVIIPDDSFETFAVLQSSMHEAWASKLSSSLTTGGGYRPSDCLSTFPMPCTTEELRRIGSAFFKARELLLATHGTLNNVYAKLHDQLCDAPEIRDLRKQMEALDQAVAAAYGWQDLDLSHGFHETKQGIRFTISEAARREVLDRLLALNHQRHAEEVAAAATQASATPAKRGRKKEDAGGQATMDF
ncbi:MAG: hypothetical protein HDKAJFGB_03931 [Anaerolineae bacterium]|nr:hypothetical protein [Anaerolineae bacterium]